MSDTSLLARWPPELFTQLPERTISDITSALRYGNGERGLDNILADIVSGQKQIWVHSIGDKFNGTVITQLTEYPQKRTCELLYLGADKAMEALHEIHTIELWALENDCHDIQAIGRAGWVKLMAKHEFKQRYTVIGKNL